MRTLLIGIMGGLVALAGPLAAVVITIGLASTANASATIDLLWGGTSATTTSVITSSSITLDVVITAGAGGSVGGGVTVDYSSAAGGKLSVVSFANSPSAGALPLILGAISDTGTQIRNVNAAALPPYVGTGLSAGASYTLGTITFHKGAGAGTFVITSTTTATDDILDASNGVITSTTTFNSATLVNAAIPEPGTVSLLAFGLGGLALAGRRKS